MAADPATGGLGMDKGFTLKLFELTPGTIFMAPSLGGSAKDRHRCSLARPVEWGGDRAYSISMTNTRTLAIVLSFLCLGLLIN